MRSFFIFDVESVGLHGEGFAVAGGVYLENGAAQWEFCYCCPIDGAYGDDEGRKWVKENVPVMEITHHTPLGVRQAFWANWLKAKQDGALMAAECAWPVEARFLCACIDDELETQKWNGPYPLIDISSLMLASGLDPMGTYERKESCKPAHNPLADARHSAALLERCLHKNQP